MAYGSDIDALGNSHRYILSANANDSVGAANGTNSGGVFTGTQICEDTTNSYQTNSVNDRITLPTTTTINNSAQTRKAVCGWFMASAIQNPPKNIYGEGDATQAFRFVLGWGNYLVFEVDSASFTIQVFGDVPLAANRPYHLCAVFEGSGYSNEFRAYLDGVEQLRAEPTNRQPGATTLPARTVGEFGDPAGTVGVGGVAVVILAPINGHYSQWAMFDGANAVLTDTEVRETLFERGALAQSTVSTGTESAMQIALDALTVFRANEALDVEVEAVTGGGDFTLTSDLVFDDLTSMHFRYNGTADELTIVNVSGGNATQAKSGAPFGGTIVVKDRQTLTVTVLDATTKTAISGARVYIEADTGGPETAGTVIMNTTTNVSGVATATYDFNSDQPIIGRVRKGSASTYYKTAPIGGPLTSTPLDVTVLMVVDE